MLLFFFFECSRCSIGFFLLHKNYHQFICLKPHLVTYMSEDWGGGISADSLLGVISQQKQGIWKRIPIQAHWGCWQSPIPGPHW